MISRSCSSGVVLSRMCVLLLSGSGFLNILDDNLCAGVEQGHCFLNRPRKRLAYGGYGWIADQGRACMSSPRSAYHTVEELFPERFPSNPLDTPETTLVWFLR